MKTKHIAVTLLLCSLCASYCAAQDQSEKLDIRSTDALISKLDLILQRLQSIETRLDRLEAKGTLSQSDMKSVQKIDPKAIPQIRWHQPPQRISPATDAGMLLDAIERTHNRNDIDPNDALPGQILQKQDGVIIREPGLRFEPQPPR